ncbi:MAG: PH domain-containing protein [Candidatus Nanopelagicales bacterium]
MASYADSLLTTSEHVVYRTRKHWIAPVVIALPATFIILGGVIALLIHLLVDIRGLNQLTLWGGWIAVLVGASWLGNSFARWASMEYVVTNQKVIKAWGILRKFSESASLEKINEISMEQGLIGRVLGYGTLQVRTASDSADLRYWAMETPQEYRKEILEAKHAYERADAEFIAGAFSQSRSAGDPATLPAGEVPPPRAAVAPVEVSEFSEGSAAAAIVDPSPPTSADAEQAGDVPALLAKLGALRDAGVLTAAEFEAKKAELLGRL